MNKIIKNISMILLTSILSSCKINTENSNVDSSSESISEKESESESIKESESTSLSESESTSEKTVEVNQNFVFSNPSSYSNPTVEQMPETIDDYTPITFDPSTYTETKEVLGDGVTLIKGNYTLNDSRKISPYMVEVDLTKANIVAGSYENTTNPSGFANKSTPLSQANAWEKDNPGKKVLAVTNADFFGTTCVNAFVKDGVIMKDSHIDDENDLPVSSPMLFGVSSAGARIGAMTTTGSRSKDYKAKLTYGTTITMYNADGTIIESVGNGTKNQENSTNSFSLYVNSTVTTLKAQAGIVYKLKRIQMESGNVRACIVKKFVIAKRAAYHIYYANEQAGDGYLFVGKDAACQEYELGTYLYESSYVTSPNNTWDYYDTILGCRHSLIENGVLPETLSRETSNGTASNCPRTCVGIKPDGKVIILSVEDMHYGGYSSTCTGITATQMADFLRYYGVYDAANFDGGGSTQLLTKTETTSFKVQTKSSDYSIADAIKPENSRKVLNTIIVTTK